MLAALAGVGGQGSGAGGQVFVIRRLGSDCSQFAVPATFVPDPRPPTPDSMRRSRE